MNEVEKQNVTITLRTASETLCSLLERWSVIAKPPARENIATLQEISEDLGEVVVPLDQAYQLISKSRDLRDLSRQLRPIASTSYPDERGNLVGIQRKILHIILHLRREITETVQDREIIRLASELGVELQMASKELVNLNQLITHRVRPEENTSVLSQSLVSIESYKGGKYMDHKHGFQALNKCLAGADMELLSELATLEERFRKNEQAERIFGSSENTRNEHSQTIFSLNEFSLKHCGISFNDLCMGELLPVKPLTKVTDRDIATFIQELNVVVKEANAAEREASERLWQAVQQNRVEQAEIAATVDALRRWARSIQKTGLPVSNGLRTAILSLTQPTEGTDGMYNYLHFALPLLPGLLNVESEIDLNKLWAEIKQRWDKQKKIKTQTKDLARVIILLEGEVDQFTQTEQNSLVFALSRIINVSTEQICILNVAPGSISVMLEMPEQAAQLLVSLYLANDVALNQLHIQKVELQRTKGNGAIPMPVKPVLNIGKAWAVLIGVNHYADASIPSLKVCVDDVTAIHQSLTGSYEVAKLLTDATPEHLPTRANILGELSTVAQSVSEDDLLLFYFSGHGMARDGESYLLARDTRLSTLKHTAVAMKDIREIITQSPAHAKVIVLDACHSGASIGKAEPTMTPEFIQRVFEQAEGMAVLASCKENQQSWEWPEKQRSVFTYYLLDALTGKADFESKGFVSISDVSNYVTDGVKTWAVQRSVPQTPTLQYTAAGDIILLRYSH